MSCCNEVWSKYQPGWGWLRTQRTNLILDHGVTNVFDQATELIRIPNVVEESLDLALLCQWLEFPGNLL
jgi:hypothetical protein